MAGMTLGEAAQAMGVSVATLRRWDRQGLIQTTRDGRNRRLIPDEEVRRLRRTPPRQEGDGRLSARNSFAGRIASIETDDLMALVEIDAGPHRIIAAVTRDAVEELRLVAGEHVVARVKATDVLVERRDGGDEDAAV
jgi:molybdopterin-binding protein